MRSELRLALATGTIGLLCILSSPTLSIGAGDQQFVYPATLSDGQRIGDLVLGETTLEQALKMFPPLPPGFDQGKPRPPRGAPKPDKGQVPVAKTVFNPWRTLYALYFDDNQKLIIIVDGGKSMFRGLRREGITKRYPQLRETSYRTDLEYEMQGEIQSCVTLGALFSIETNTVGDSVFWYTCPTK